VTETTKATKSSGHPWTKYLTAIVLVVSIFLVYKASQEKKPTDVYDRQEVLFRELFGTLKASQRSSILADTVDAANVGVIGCDNQFRTTWVSDGMERMHGAQIELGERPLKIIPEPFRRSHEGDDAKWIDSQPKGIWTVVTPELGGGYLRNDGTFVPATVFVQRVSPDFSGAPLVAIIIDQSAMSVRNSE